ncbi:MAG: glycoside hydrolase [Chloroflexi bacterium]|nr:MAG: glycoside hydrolase [Chloroflexota bacterium]
MQSNGNWQTPPAGSVVVMAGTRKGTFLFYSDPARRTWHRTQAHLGWSTHAVNYDPRHNALYAATNSAVFGALVQRSDDGGVTWQHFNQGLDFDAGQEERVREVWQVQPGHADRPDEVWAGTNAAGLFRSDDRGVTWSPVTSLQERSKTDNWFPGGGGLILHTIVPDPARPDRLYAGISAAGVYRSDDGGASWQPMNRNVRADFMPDPYPETGHCVHKMVVSAAAPDRLYQQNHCGVYRSDDGGGWWEDISDGLPSRFGFPMAIHPHDADTVWVVPLTGDDRRVVPDEQMAVWRSRNRGLAWERLTNGLPYPAYFTILRDALATDACDPAGVYVGTTTGQLFYSRDEGERWELLADHLPPVLAVHAAQIVGG